MYIWFPNKIPPPTYGRDKKLNQSSRKVVSERLGHASITLTMDTYSHVLPDMQQGASDKLERMLFAKTGTQ